MMHENPHAQIRIPWDDSTHVVGAWFVGFEGLTLFSVLFRISSDHYRTELKLIRRAPMALATGSSERGLY